jgi:hypothetical protein
MRTDLSGRIILRPDLGASCAALLEPGAAGAEVASLMFRQGAAPDLVSAKRAPAPDPANRPVIVAAGGLPDQYEDFSINNRHARQEDA